MKPTCVRYLFLSEKELNKYWLSFGKVFIGLLTLLKP